MSKTFIGPVDSLADILAGRPVDLLADASPWVTVTIDDDVQS